MCFEFVKRSGDYDLVSGGINIIANLAVVAIGGISLGAISYLALKALGFSGIATTTATAIPVTIGAFGVAGVIVTGCVFLHFISKLPL